MLNHCFLGRYQSIRLLGEGGMGKVYLARDYNLQRQVVVKVMHEHIASDPKFRQHFETETLLTARFEHPYAVRVYDAAYDKSAGPCIIMEHVRGVTLSSLLKKNKGRLNPARMGRLLGQLCEALQAAHTQGIIHRDLKPANLMVVEPDTPSEKVKVMDFGLATQHDEQSAGDGQPTGTPTYMSPEQARGQPVDHRSDIYSVGVILYEVLTGEPPFKGSSSMDIMIAHVNDEPLAFSARGNQCSIPPAVERVVFSCLAKDPAERPASAHELAELFQKVLLGKRTRLDKPASPPPETVSTPLVANGQQVVIDPRGIIFHMQASLHPSVAERKLSGFVRDAGGSVIESVPGMIRVRLGEPGSKYELNAGALSWVGLGRGAGLAEVYLYLRPADPRRPDLQLITVLMISLKGRLADDPLWCAHCGRIYANLKGYLMGHDVQVAMR